MSFDEYGIMLPWWSRAASVSDADRSNPTSSESAKYFAGYDGGRLLRNTWFWIKPPKILTNRITATGGIQLVVYRSGRRGFCPEPDPKGQRQELRVWLTSEECVPIKKAFDTKIPLCAAVG